jgi:hypothetical protein
VPLKPQKSVGRKVGTTLAKSSETADFRHFPLDDGDPYGKISDFGPRKTQQNQPSPSGPTKRLLWSRVQRIDKPVRLQVLRTLEIRTGSKNKPAFTLLGGCQVDRFLKMVDCRREPNFTSRAPIAKVSNSHQPPMACAPGIATLQPRARAGDVDKDSGGPASSLGSR